MKALINGKTTISIILACLMAFMLPVEVFAKAEPKSNTSSKVEFDTLGEAEEDGQVVTELKERRDEHTKHFRMDDGTIMAVSYDLPVHFKNDKGNWVEYNNTLVAEEEATPDEAAEPEYYTNKKSNIDIDIPADIKPNNSLRIKSSKGEISWKYIGQKDSKIKIPKTKKINSVKDKASVEKLTSTASYNNVYKDVNLDYVVSSIGVKENLVLQNKSAQNEFEIEYDIKGYTLKKVDNRTFTLNKNGKPIYTIAVPCMYDKKGTVSSDLRFEQLKSNKNKLRVKLIADKSFLNNSKTEYPVTIDPEVILFGSQNIETAQIDQTAPSENQHQSTHFYVGKSSNNHIYSGLVKVKEFQNEYQDKYIVSAKLNIYPMNQSNEMEIEAYPVNNSWTYGTVTYSNVSHSNEVIDYATIADDSERKTVFDITKYAKKWVSGTYDNNGIMLKSNDRLNDFGGYCCYFSNRLPSLIVKYKDYTGLESNLTSHTVPCGQDAVLSVCDYTGSLSAKQIFYNENTERFPLSIYATYHSTRNATNEQSGYGWHYSFNQTISEDDNYYKYIDADGVDHYFKKESGSTRLSDEDDSEYTLIIDNDKIKIDNDSTTKTFEIVDNSDIYKLKNEKSNENENNSISYTYNSSGYLTKITTLLDEYNIIRNDNHLITKIYFTNTKYMEFMYYSGTSLLKMFISRDGKATFFDYTSQSNEGLINEIRYNNVGQGNVTGGGVTCNYNSANKVSSITELGKNGSTRKALSVTYNDDNTTEFKEIENNNKKETYTFDNYGNTISVLNANGMITNASEGGLSINTGADSHTKNYLADLNEPEGIDGSYDLKKGAGLLGPHTTVTGNACIVDDTSYMGSKSIKIENEKNIHNATTVYKDIDTTDSNWETIKGKTITLSSYVMIGGSNKLFDDFTCGAYLSIRCFGSAGDTNAISFGDSISVAKTVNGWDRVSTTITVPDNAAKIRVIMGLRNTYGTAWFDCIQLEEGKVMSDYNALSNSDFSGTSNWKNQNDGTITLNNNNAEISGSGGEPAPTEETTASEETTSSTEEATSATYTQTVTETVANDVVEETNSYGSVIKSEQGFVTRTYNRTYEVAETDSESSEPSESSGDEEAEAAPILCNQYIYQEVDVNKQDVSFVLTGSARAQSVPLNSEYRTFGIALKIKYEGDSDYSEDHYQEFNAFTDSMQSVALSVTPNDSGRTVEKVAFAFVYGYNKNKMIVKNASLNYAYNGAKSEQPTEPETTEPESTSPTEETAASETTETATENEDNLIDEEIVAESINTDEEYMRSQKSYDSNGNYVTSEVDEAGNTTSYENDADGNVIQITDGRGNSVSYSYDFHSNLTSVSQGDSSNTYTYNTYNELSKITHNGFDYNYTYSNFGEPTSVKVGNQALITYTYDSNGNVLTATYGNGDHLDYTYDSYARLTEVVLNDNTNSPLATYAYNKKGQLTKFTDGKSGETTEYCYDCNGNALYKYIISEDGELLRVVDGETEKTKINGSERTIINGTDDDGKSYVQNGNAKITSESDDFGRTTEIKTSIKDEDDFVEKFNLSYTYKNVGETHQTTNSVDEMTYKLGNDTEVAKYKYSYDSNGNITGVWDNNVKIAEYTYDSLNQLTECADKTADKYFVYNYDNSGNITSLETYSLVNGLEQGALERTDTYGYAASGWKDQLVSYKNDSFTYDNIGNPTSYRDGMTMSWTGRELQSITKNSNTYNFTYNLDGLRTKREKKQGDTVLETVNYYYDDSNNLIGLKKGNTTVLFYYDSEGKVYSMTKGDDTYFFIKNLQGDVTKIIDENGNTCATYAYNAWGALLTQNEDNSIAGLNPFRYKGYVYDSETELYYLQSRYYDPKIGRFINADDSAYTDTYSGSPLSTNMFAYCENNTVSGYDPEGNWDIQDHKIMTKNAGFSKITQEWSAKPDGICGNDDFYSAPFHSRGKRVNKKGEIVVYGALECARYMYNKALELKKQYNNGNRSKVNFKYAESNATNCIKKAYMGFEKKENKQLTNTVSTNCSKAKALISALNNNNYNRKDQAEAMLGLSLHTLQDYYAHKIKVNECTYNNKVLKTAEGKTINNITQLNKVIFPKNNLIMEDNPDFLAWRYSTAVWMTKNVIMDCYKQNREIKTIEIYSVVPRDVYFYTYKKSGQAKVSFKYDTVKGYSYKKYHLNYNITTLYVDTKYWGYVF